MKKKDSLSEKDKKDWQDFLEDKSLVPDKDTQFNDGVNKTKFIFDLHGLNLSEANKKVKEIIKSCSEKNYEEILLITGKGLHSTSDKDSYVSKQFSKLKYSVPDFIKNNNDLKKLITSITDADRIDGGEGAILIRLKNL